MTDDPHRIVERGYDTIASRYLAWGGDEPSPVREQVLRRLLEALPPGADVLELGCGAGEPMTRRLVDAGHRVVGVDISAAQLALARERLPEVELIQANVVQLQRPEASMDAVVAFYVITHIPRDEHAPLLSRIASWLRPGGLLLASFGTASDAGTIDADWLGAPMYFSHFDAETNRSLVGDAGLTIDWSEVLTEDEDGTPVSFLWILARRPSADGGPASDGEKTANIRTSSVDSDPVRSLRG